MCLGVRDSWAGLEGDSASGIYIHDYICRCAFSVAGWIHERWGLRGLAWALATGTLV